MSFLKGIGIRSNLLKLRRKPSKSLESALLTRKNWSFVSRSTKTVSPSSLIMQELSFGTTKASFTSEAGKSTLQAKGRKMAGDMITLQENMYIQAILSKTSEMDTA